MQIELLGPSGVGKTTLLDSVRSLWASKIILPDTIELFLKQSTEQESLKIVNKSFSQNDPLSKDYLPFVLDAIARTSMTFEQKFTVIEAVRNSIVRNTFAHLASGGGKCSIHDELLLHRGFSFLVFAADFKNTVREYYEKVPVPQVAVICKASISTILDRAKKRELKLNWHKGLSSAEIKEATLKMLAICDIAEKTLASRGVDVRIIDTDQALDESCAQLNGIIQEFAGEEAHGGSKEEYLEHLKERAVKSGKSFRKKEGRHYPVTPDVAYCAFTTPNFSIHKSEAQRDAPTRFANFGITKKSLKGKRVLDLGCNIGAMLFQATNYEIAEGLGIEYDYEKVKIAREIAELAELKNLSFRTGDIDSLKAEDLGVFDVTFALAVEGHVMNQEKLYELLSRVTGETLYFEGNGTCDYQEVERILLQKGFQTVTYLGSCTDDVVRRNNCRPLLKASK